MKKILISEQQFDKLLESQLIKENTYTLYHTTNDNFNRLDVKKTAMGVLWFTDSLNAIKNKTTGANGFSKVLEAQVTINNPAGWDEYDKLGFGQLKDRGYDGVILPNENGATYIVFSNKQIKKLKQITIPEETINEAKNYYDFWEISYVYNTIQEFLHDKANGKTKKTWRLIPFEQYRNALIEFMRYGQFMRFPAKYIDQWADIVTNNTLSLAANTELAGHSRYFPFEEFCDAFGFEQGTPEYEKYYGNYENCAEYLYDIGFDDWTIAPDGTDAISDYGLEPLYNLIMELEEQETPEQKIVVINKILDVYHMRGDLASLFIQGGTKSLSQISYPEPINENVNKGHFVNIDTEDENVRLELWEDNDKLELLAIVIPKDLRGQGYGSKLMEKIITYADSVNKPIYLTPDKSYGATSVNRLKDFYKQFGFKKNQDLAVSQSMVRYPNPTIEEADDHQQEPVASYTSEAMIDNFLDEHNLNDYKYVINEYESYHEFCPLGFDLNVDKENKLITLDIYLENEPPSNRVFWQTVVEELEMEFNEQEPLDEMAYPTSFNMDDFKAIKSFAGRVDYCRQNLTRIAEGSSRMVFQVDDEIVLKLAKNTKGLIQNEAEARMGANENYYTCIAYVKDFDEDKFTFVEMEKAKKCSRDDFKRITGVDFETSVNFIRAEENNTLRKEFSQEYIDEVYDEHLIMAELIDFIRSWDMARGDLYRLEHYGVVKRDGEEYVVLIDYGLTEKIFAKHYNKTRH